MRATETILIVRTKPCGASIVAADLKTAGYRDLPLDVGTGRGQNGDVEARVSASHSRPAPPLFLGIVGK
jgi:hypothetical protein